MHTRCSHDRGHTSSEARWSLWGHYYGPAHRQLTSDGYRRRHLSTARGRSAPHDVCRKSSKRPNRLCTSQPHIHTAPSCGLGCLHAHQGAHVGPGACSRHDRAPRSYKRRFTDSYWEHRERSFDGRAQAGQPQSTPACPARSTARAARAMAPPARPPETRGTPATWHTVDAIRDESGTTSTRFTASK